MTEDNGNGDAQPSQEEFDAMRALMFQQAVAETAKQLSGFFPEKTDQQLVEAAARAITDQSGPGMASFIADAQSAESIRRHPAWGIRVRRKGATAAGQVGTVLVPVDTGEVRSMDEINQWCTVLALATSPLARAALDLFGLEVQFIRANTVPGRVRLGG